MGARTKTLSTYEIERRLDRPELIHWRLAVWQLLQVSAFIMPHQVIEIHSIEKAVRSEGWNHCGKYLVHCCKQALSSAARAIRIASSRL